MVKVGNIEIGGGKRFVLLAGPCAIESREIVFETARELKRICNKLDIDLVFKSSFDKANRTSASARGIGMDEGLKILREVKEQFDLPIVTDVHESWQCEQVAAVADILQIPAFLSRQTDLIQSAARTGRVVNVKKGQFMAPWDMQGVISKVKEVVDNASELPLLLCERGSSFGYGNLVVDMSGLVQMRQLGCPVVFDATHCVQKPSSQAGVTGGNRELVPYMMRAALAVGVDAIFMEVHPDPDMAISDAANQVRLSDVEEILRQAVAVDDLVKGFEKCETRQIEVESESEKQINPLSGIKVLLTDVDGVLTDGGMYYANSADELKRFQVKDGMGLKLLQKAGLKIGIITSENVTLNANRAKKLGLDYFYQGHRKGGKLEAAVEICKKERITLEQVAYIGDDINCYDLLTNVGYAACPIDAVKEIKQIPNIHIMTKKGGHGCVRELCDMILHAQISEIEKLML